MGGSDSKLTHLQTETITSSESTVNSQNSPAYNDIHRLAIDQSAVIGSLYDARKDCFLEKISLGTPSTSRKLEEKPLCMTTNGDELQSDSLTDFIDVDQDLCLSVRLNMVPQGELSSLITYSLTEKSFTRILYYYYCSEEKYMENKQNINGSSIPVSIQKVTVTHVCTKIKSGIIVVVVLQLSPSDESYLNSVLKKLKNELTENSFNLSETDKRLLTRFTFTKVFSNISDITKLTKLTDICQKIIKIKSEAAEHRLLGYTLKPIQCFYPAYPTERSTYIPLEPKIRSLIEQRSSDLSLIEKPWKISIIVKQQQSLENHIKQKFFEVQQQISEIEEIYRTEIEKLSNMVYELRSRAHRADSSIEMLMIEKITKLLEKATNVTEELNKLIKKAKFIDDCGEEQIEYCNVRNILDDNDRDLETITTQLLKRGKQKHIFCFDDRLAEQPSSQWMDFYTKLLKERRSKPQVEFVYADFSFCTSQLPEMKILKSDNIKKQRKSLEEKPTVVATISSSTKHHVNERNSSNNNIINVLLLGESGVGKSTFVNAIVNYLTFDTIEHARSGQPVVLMPVSFLMTTGDHFKEQIVKFGDVDLNEDHTHPGQSVTQQCRSYVFTIGTQTKLRLIDTPGMGDTRGLDQDDLNMQHILSFINNLSHLNAICILLKPNEARLNVVFRSYFTRLIGFLGENARNNIIFCFTNTRGTFFAPGDSGPLLRQMLESQSIKDIPFKKTNTFCFDNEAFRYLVARLNRIDFDDYQKEEYTRSWVTSVNESNRLLRYICNELRSYRHIEWQSIEHAQCQITQLVRPLLETTRNIFRNIILQQAKPSKPQIKLCPKAISQPSTICTKRKRVPQLCSDFWILPDDLQILSDRCTICKSNRKRHINVDYKLDYKSLGKGDRQAVNELDRNLDQLTKVIFEFGYFFVYTTAASEANDPILSYLNQIMEEENQICQEKGANCLNSILHKKLIQFKKEYEGREGVEMSKKKSGELSSIYELIQSVSGNDLIREQIDVIKLYQQKYMMELEKKLS